jgi:hypothetical protein
MKEVLSAGKSLEEYQLKECKREERTIKIDLGKIGFGGVNLKRNWLRITAVTQT